MLPGTPPHLETVGFEFRQSVLLRGLADVLLPLGGRVLADNLVFRDWP
jgi:hypothetical protein